MAKKSTLLDVFEKNQYDLKTAVKKSRAWFEQQVLIMTRQQLTPQRVLNGNPEQLVTRIMPGHLYMFVYDPKTKAELPYYDRFPLVFPFRKTPDGFIGLNMHYLPHRLRIILMERLMIFASNDKMDATTKLRYSWALIDGVSKFSLAKPCVKRYLTNHLKSPLVNVPADDWTTAMMLPVERFTKATKEYVWSESRKKI